MKIAVNKILGIGIAVVGGLTDCYVETKMYEAEEKKDSILAAIARLSVGTMIRAIHAKVAIDIMEKEGLQITIPSLRSDGDKLLDKVYRLVEKHQNGKITLTDVRKKIYAAMVKYPDITIGERVFLIQLIESDTKLYKTIEDDTFRFAMLIGESLEELPTGEEMKEVSELLSTFSNYADDIYNLIENFKEGDIIRRNLEMKFDELLYRKYSSIKELKGIVKDIETLYKNYMIE